MIMDEVDGLFNGDDVCLALLTTMRLALQRVHPDAHGSIVCSLMADLMYQWPPTKRPEFTEKLVEHAYTGVRQLDAMAPRSDEDDGPAPELDDKLAALLIICGAAMKSGYMPPAVADMMRKAMAACEAEYMQRSLQ